MNPVVTLNIRDEVAVVTLDNPPVNAITQEMVDALMETLARIERDPAARAVVIVGAGRTFIAGADIKALERLAWGEGGGAPEMHAALRRIEDFPKPVVAALHGTALGGGLEVAMAAHYRVAVRDAQMGQPEVNLGIIPGAEGTQRLSRLVGVEKAIEMCVTGKPIRAPEALEAGLIDRLIDGDLIVGAVAFAREAAGRTSHPRTRDRRDKLPSPDALPALVEAGRALAEKTRRHQEAPRAVVDAIAASVTLPFDEGCVRERGLFMDCVRSEQAKALIHIFFAERTAAHVPGVDKETPVPPVARVGIIGAGTMGTGIAMACANAGLDVVLIDVAQAGLDSGMAAIRRNYDASVRRGRLTPAAVDERLARIRPQLGYEGFKTLDLVIEAVFENLALKKEVFAALDRATRPEVLLGTNTSTLNIDEIAAATSQPARVVGLHFFSPANVMRLVEIVRGATTAPQTVAAALAFARRLGKVGVVVGNCPGFVGNRIMFPYMYEAQFIAEEGATPWQIDQALTDFGMAMGIFAVDDLAGLDVAWRVRQELGQFREPGRRKPLVADRLCEMGRLGQKTGRGWYRYEHERTPRPDPEVEALIEQLAAAGGIRRRTIDREEIIERTIYALINEGARVLDEGFALRASDIDVIYVNGYGFPAWRGGPMFYADRVGLGRIHDRVSAFHREHGARWEPAPLLARLAREGKTFRQFDAERTAAVGSRA